MRHLRTQTQLIQALKKNSVICIILATLAFQGCGGSGGDSTPTDNNVRSLSDYNIPPTYTFASKFDSSLSSVFYSGQTKRLILIEDIVDYILNLQDSASVEVFNNLNFFYAFDGSSLDGLPYRFTKPGVMFEPGPNYGDITSGKSLSGKIAGNDPQLINNEFFGWNTALASASTAPTTPDALVQQLFDALDQISTDEATESIPLSSGTAEINAPYISAQGLDFRQLIQKFLLGAVVYSQGVGDYLQANYREGNASPEGTQPYSFLEHEWDEAFGYFGAARNYNDYSDNEIAGKPDNETRSDFENGYQDTNNNGLIDLTAEINLANSTNCAKRDRDATVETDFTATAFNAFLAGRTILNQTDGELDDAAFALLDEARLTASRTWEKCIAATVVHYINDVLADMNAFEVNGYASLNAFLDHAKHWAEMKGFALGLQFNPDSPFRDNPTRLDQLKQVLNLMGDAPILPDGTQNTVAFAGGISAYTANLQSARSILQDVYQFNPQNVQNW